MFQKIIILLLIVTFSFSDDLKKEKNNNQSKTLTNIYTFLNNKPSRIEKRVEQLEKLETRLKNKKLTDFQKISLINNYYNKFKYISDKKLWNKRDYWVSPSEFNIIRYGDCDDFALAKYYMLKKMDIGVTQDIYYVYTKKKQAHAITLVKLNNGITYVLDNLRGKIKPLSETYYRKKLIFSYNQNKFFGRYLKNLTKFEQAIVLN